MRVLIIVSELDRQSNEDGLSVQSEKSVVLPAVSFSLGAGDEGDTESQASTLERCYPQQHYHRDNRRYTIFTLFQFYS